MQSVPAFSRIQDLNYGFNFPLRIPPHRCQFGPGFLMIVIAKQIYQMLLLFRSILSRIVIGTYYILLTYIPFIRHLTLYPRHRAGLPKQSFKTYNLFVKRQKNCKNIIFHGNCKGNIFQLHKYPFKPNNKQVISKKLSALDIAGPAALTLLKELLFMFM